MNSPKRAGYKLLPAINEDKRKNNINKDAV